MLINAKEMDYKTLNEKLRFADEDVTIENCCGQRFIASAMSGHAVTIEGVPGNALGAYLNGGEITVYGNAQDAVGDIMVIGGTAGSFLGEYQAGGVIVVLGLETEQEKIVGFFPCTGMHGGKMFLRSDCKDVTFPEQVTAKRAEAQDMEELREYVSEYCDLFGYDIETVLEAPFTVVTPDSKNLYRQMYVAN